MMRIPKKLKIGGHWYQIIYRKNRTKTDGISALGSEDFRYNRIWIDGDQAPQQLESTLLHEILEAISGLNGLKFDESVIRILETNLYQVLKDNKIIK